MKIPLPIRFAVAAALQLAVVPAMAASYPVAILGSLGGDNYMVNAANGINAGGQIAGAGSTVLGNSRGMLWNGVAATSLSALNGVNAEGHGINDSGVIVGYTQAGFASINGFGNYTRHAVAWSGGSATDLGTLGGVNSSAYGINNAGRIVGQSDTALLSNGQQVQHAASWDGHTRTDLGTLGGINSAALAVNQAGVVVGWSQTANGLYRAARWDGLAITGLAALDPNSYSSYAYGLNNVGQTVGFSALPGSPLSHAVLWNGAAIVDLGSLGGGSAAKGINDAGKIVGFSYLAPGGLSHATLWDNGQLIDLNTMLDASLVNAGWTLMSANAISDGGVIVGQARNMQTYQTQAFSMSISAVPEPATYAMLLAGLAMVLMARWRRRGRW